MPRLNSPDPIDADAILPREEIVVDAETGEVLPTTLLVEEDMAATAVALVAATSSVPEPAVPALPQTLEQALYQWGAYQVPLTMEERRLYLIAQSGVYRFRTLGQALALSEMAKVLGISEHAAFSGIYILPSGMSMSAHLIGALVRKSGVYDYRVVEMTMERCEIEWYKEGVEIGRSDFATERARRNGWIKPKSAWDTTPDEMCRARALTKGCRTFCPEVLMGGVYTPEELSDEEILGQS